MQKIVTNLWFDGKSENSTSYEGHVVDKEVRHRGAGEGLQR